MFPIKQLEKQAAYLRERVEKAAKKEKGGYTHREREEKETDRKLTHSNKQISNCYMN